MAKPLKDVDSISQSLCLSSFARFFPLLGYLGYLLGGWIGVAAAGAVCAVTAALGVWFAGRLSTLGVNFFYGMRPAHWSPAEQLEGDLNRARVHKINRRFDQALAVVDEILARCPDFAEALLLKAQILWEGYGDQYTARRCLIDVSQSVPDRNDPLHRWAAALYRSMSSAPPGRDLA